jgi:translation initiation factor 1
MYPDARDQHAEGITLSSLPVVSNRPELPQVSTAAGGAVRRLIEREVMDLAARLIGGRKRREAQEIATQTAARTTKKEVIKTSAPVVRLGRETKGRRGKGVTTVSDVPLDEAELLNLAATLKQRCGTGGTVRDRIIEIQGDQRDRLATVLEGMGYRVKRTGG